MGNVKRETLIDFIWIHNSELLEQCVSTSGHNIHIDDFGYKNEHFEEMNYCGVSLNIDGNIYKGAVKFFEDSMDWVLWSSSNRSEAKDVCLVVVSKHNSRFTSSFTVPVIVIDIPKRLEECFTSLLEHGHSCCAFQFNKYDSLTRYSHLTRMLIDRLETKYHNVEKIYKELEHNINTTFIYLLFDTLMIGTRNRDCMLELFRVLKSGKVFSHLATQQQYDAVILGAAGLLNDRYVADEHIWEMRKEFKRIEKHFDISPMLSSKWHLSRVNPSYTLWVQLAQLSAILFQNKDLIFKFILAKNLDEMHSVLMSPISDYWQGHNSPGTENNSSVKCISRGKRDIIIINAIVPFLFFYNKINTYNDESEYVDILLEHLHNTKAESNIYTRMWSSNDVAIGNAFESQAFIQICKTLCAKKLCAKCNIGISMLRATLSKQDHSTTPSL